MKYWSAGEVDSLIYDAFFEARKFTEEKINFLLSNENYTNDVNNMDVIYIIYKEGGKEKISFKTKNKELDLRILIDYEKFLNASPYKQREFLILGLLESLEKFINKNIIINFDLNKFKTDLKKIIQEENHFQEIFRNLDSKGFETTNKLTWSFYFYSKESDSIQKVITKLEGYGYISKITKDNDHEFQLIANKTEVLTAEKLQKRNIAFAQLANFCDVVYDGWEVSK